MKLKRADCLYVFLLVCLIWDVPIAAQASPAGYGAVYSGADDDAAQPGWRWTESFVGSSDSSATVTKFTSRIGYNFNRHFGADLGLPVYFVHAASTTSGSRASSGIGNAFVDGRLMLPSPRVNYYSTLTVEAPTGDAAKGFGTGRAAVDWDNRLDHSFGRLTPFADLGLGNTVPDTHFRRRSFTSLGFVSSLEAGADFDLLRYLTVGASGYADVPSGQQKIFSRGAKHRATSGPASLARDNGLNFWADVPLHKMALLELGYSRSIHLDLNTFSFGVVFNLSPLLRGGAHR